MRRQYRSTDRRTNHGFTLIEIMVVVAAICLLASVSFPVYRQVVRKARRAEGRAALLGIMQQQERYFSLFNRYIAFSSLSTEPDEKAFRWYSGNSAAKSAYEISGSPCDGESIQTCVILVATPGSKNVDATFHDDECGDLTLTSQGVKGANGDMHECWR